MSIYNSIEKVISAEILRSNEDNLIANRICNTSFVGDIKNRGDSVTFIGLSEPTVYSYEGTLDYEDISDSGVVLSIDQDMVFSFMVKDLEELRSSIGLKDSQTKRASYNLGLAVDKYVLGLYEDAGETRTAVMIFAEISVDIRVIRKGMLCMGQKSLRIYPKAFLLQSKIPQIHIFSYT